MRPELHLAEVLTPAPGSTPGLAQLRASIDGIDSQLLQLLAQRQRLVRALFPLKPADDLAADERRQQVLHTRRLWAQQLGLDERFAEKLFDTITQHFLHCQREWAQLAHVEQKTSSLTNPNTPDQTS